MEHYCAGIVKNEYHIDKCIDWDALDRLANHLPLSETDAIPWEKIEVLHF